ncbi:hypothetical protein V6N12_007888 [Hibiscus sabdariffa]|uniref:40S ribosomal protein S8 n=1 Tax=Hibiscus sabdariffa TaxID=183260 RepID=A0ABR1ZB35_9ROSI
MLMCEPTADYVRREKDLRRDQHSAYFFRRVTVRQKQNTVQCLQNSQGQKLETYEAISAELIDYFSGSLGVKDDNVQGVSDSLLKDILGCELAVDVKDDLVAPVTMKEDRFGLPGLISTCLKVAQFGKFKLKAIIAGHGKSISRDSMHKRRSTGGKKKAWRKKRKYELGRQPGNTKLSSNKTVRRIRTRGGNVKSRALRLDTGNYSWGSESVTRKTRILDVVYNASNNELVRTQTLVKSAIVQVDAAPFKQWYLQHYGIDVGRKKKTASKKEATEEPESTGEETKKSKHVMRKLEKRQKDRKLDPHVEDQFGGGRLLACISSRPGQCGRADGYILEGKELEFYMKKMHKKKGKGAGAA